MRAVWYEHGGAASAVLQSGQIDVPEPGAGEVRVRIAYSAVNPYDVKKRADGREAASLGRVIPHADGSGEIDKVGTGVSAQRIGEHVWLFGAQVGQAHGTCAECCVVPAWKAVTLPKVEWLSLKDGACLGIPAVTALRALSLGGAIAGKTVLVCGGAGRVGAYAVQFAKRLDARVIATASAGAREEVEALGADCCLDYRDAELGMKLRECVGRNGADVIVEPRFGGNIGNDARILSRGGVIAAYGFDDAASPAVPVMQLVMKNAACHFIGIFALNRAEQETLLEQVNALISQPGVRHRVGLEVALADVAMAHERIESGSVSGAALIRM